MSGQNGALAGLRPPIATAVARSYPGSEGLGMGSGRLQG
jgi:hypothetical protein